MTAPGPDAAPDAAERVVTAIREYARAAELECEDGTRDGELVLTLPGERKLKTVTSLVVGEDRLSVRAFVVRNPDENHEKVYRYLLRRNLRLPGLAYAIDRSGDVFLTGQVPLAGIDEDYLDHLFGAVLTACDEPFNELLVLGFLTSMRREWAWRVDRGESTANLEAFRHLLENPPDAPAPS